MTLNECSQEETMTGKDDKIETDLVFLRSAIEPQEKILQSWEATYHYRREQYKDCPIQKILDDFPALKLNTGIDLVRKLLTFIKITKCIFNNDTILFIFSYFCDIFCHKKSQTKNQCAIQKF